MKKAFFLLIFILISVLVGYYYRSHIKKIALFTDKDIVHSSGFTIEFSKFLSENWRRADLENSECLPENAKELSIDELSCHPKVFQCQLSKKPSFNYEGVKVPFSIVDMELVSYAPKRYKVEFLIKSKKMSFHLLDSCREVYLPQRNYPFFVSSREIKTEWDNFNKDIFVDKFKVKNWQFTEWLRFTSQYKLLKRYESTELFSSATNVSLENMKKFCKDQKKSILQAKVYDAMTIFPEEISNPSTKLLRAPFYYWTRRNSSSPLYRLQMGEPVEDKDIEQICLKVSASDCPDNITRNLSWMGVSDIGSKEMEYVRNPENPSENIVLSSRNFPLKSSVHRTGVRGEWNRDGFSHNDFNFKKYDRDLAQKEIEVSFRCMRRK